ncbi:T9SS type A sorting domain-containing protein [Litoribacter alkaliphilus]|uniref:T9SS type A sorting domain-containing protein n=1 Tax=Litoribacter ruber TaxID=702568 RepID=A0AAP2G4J7_9BACT|nr:choice-of-anchor tandem repeat GloVer-containing protein [Litoribacter alkaliphilus]MBS9524136.1 T9SS type A sorting domain-containing protein [Litoribacter alkaliphilus]
MKPILLKNPKSYVLAWICYLLLAPFIIQSVVAQDKFYGSSQSGYDFPGGFIYAVNSDGSDFQVIKDFAPTPGAFSNGLLLLDDGDFMASSNTQRALYRFSGDGSNFETIPINARPLGLFLAADGFIYGSAEVQISDDDVEARIFRISQDGSGLEFFENPAGILPREVLHVSDGYFYTSQQYGILKIRIAGNEATMLGEAEFRTDFFSPSVALVFEEDWIYGFAADNNGRSRFYRMGTDGTDFQYLRQFEEFGNFEFRPVGKLLLSDNNYLYGFARRSGTSSAAFRIGLDGSGFEILHEFPSELHLGSLSERDDMLFGITERRVFSLEKNGDNFTQLFTFDPPLEDPNFSSPLNQNIAFDNDDNLLALTYNQIYIASPNSADLDSLPLPLNVEGLSPINLVQVGNTFYGINRFGGEFGHGTIFKIENGQFEITRQLDQEFAFSHLEAGQGGNLYAMGNRLVRIFAEGTDLEIIREFTGSRFIPKKLFYKDGYLYGEDGDEVFSMDTEDNSFSSIFDIQDLGPNFNLLLLTKGGTFYAISQKSPTLRELVTFSDTGSDFQVLLEYDTEEINDILALIETEDGGIFGIYQDDESTSGKLFQLENGDSDFGVLYNFPWVGESLIEGSDNSLYGTAGGFSSYLYQIEKDGTGFSEIFAIENSGLLGMLVKQSMAAPPMDKFPLWGLSSRGDQEIGAIFSLQNDGSDFTSLRDFVPSDGEIPVGKPIFGSDGYFYGMTRDGGSNGLGTLYKIKPDGTSFSVIHNFAEPDGTHPLGSLEWGGDNYLYGAAYSGGNAGGGTVFRIRPNGSGFEVLKHFDQEQTDQGFRPSEILLADDGEIYGHASGGNQFNGLLYSLERDGSDFTILRHFDDPDGRYPTEDLIQGSDGYIYGLTEEGGSRRGTLYKVSLDGSEFMVLRSFNRSEEGFYPIGQLLEYGQGVLYGVLEHGVEEDGDGSIYKINADGSGFEVLHRFVFPISSPSSGLVAGPDGLLYGMTINAIYRISPSGSNFEVIKEVPSEYSGIRGLALAVSGDCIPAEIGTVEIIPSNPVGSTTTITASASYSGSIQGAKWNWGDGNTIEATLTDSTIVGTHSYSTAGSYQVTLEVSDACGVQVSPSIEVEVTDEASQGTGSVKGEGMFLSPRGAYVSRPQVKGMAHYTFSAKATEGKVKGNFQFKIADLHLRSTRFSSLVIEDNKAWLQGEGRIKGRGKYGFLLAMVDEEDKSNEKSYRKWKSRGKDKLRVKIWNLQKDGRVVYDNQLGDAEGAVATATIERGTIIILEEETLPDSIAAKDFLLEQLKKIKAYPNPASDRITIDLGDIDPELIQSMLTDAYGNLEIRNVHRKAGGNKIEVDVSSLRFGTYYIRIYTDKGSHSIKIMKK